jgi:hypothetical protein
MPDVFLVEPVPNFMDKTHISYEQRSEKTQTSLKQWTVLWNSVQKITPTHNLINNGLREVKFTHVRTKPLMMVTL